MLWNGSVNEVSAVEIMNLLAEHEDAVKEGFCQERAL